MISQASFTLQQPIKMVEKIAVETIFRKYDKVQRAIS